MDGPTAADRSLFQKNKICVKHIVDPHWHDGAGAHGAQQLLTGLSGQKIVINFFCALDCVMGWRLLLLMSTVYDF